MVEGQQTRKEGNGEGQSLGEKRTMYIQGLGNVVGSGHKRQARVTVTMAQGKDQFHGKQQRAISAGSGQ